MKINKVQKGFTLIELMITVAIVGILSAVALPAYSDYTNRAKAAEAISLLGGLKIQVADYYNSKSDLPDDATALGKTNATDSLSTGKYVDTITLGANGVLTATFGDTAKAGGDLAAKTVSMTPTVNNGQLTWVCAAGATNPVPAQYLPSGCK